jgi:hypothetical protein
MKKSILSLAVGVAIATGALTGCEPVNEQSPDLADSLVQSDAIKLSVEQANKENKELKEFLAQARKLDPSIVSVYYSYNADGEKFINIVRKDDNEENEQSVEPAPASTGGAVASSNYEHASHNTFGMSMAGSLVGSALANAMIPSHPSPDYYHGRSDYRYRESMREEEKRRNSAVASYNSTMVSKNVSKVRSSPTRMKAINTRVQTSKAAFRSSGSARSGAYSGGSRGFGG